MVRNVAVEAGKNARSIKTAVQPAFGRHQLKTFMGMLAENPYKKWLSWAISFNMRKATIQ